MHVIISMFIHHCVQMLPFEQAAFFEIVAEPLSFSFRVRILCRYRTPY